MMKMIDDESIFLQILGASPKMKILDFLLTFQAFDYSLTEVAQKTSVSYPIVVNVMEDFLRNGMIAETRKIGKARLFKLDEQNHLTKQLLKLQWEMAKNPAVFIQEESNNKAGEKILEAQ